MKIVHLCLSNFFIDGYSYQENMLTKYHVKMGYEVTVIASSFSYNKEGKGCYLTVPSERMDENGYKVIRLAYKKPVKLNSKLRRYENFYNVLSNESPDIIFSHGVAMAEVNTLIKYLKRNPHVKLYGDHHGDYINSATNFLSKHVQHKILWRYYVKKLEPYLIKCYGVTPMRCRFLKEMYHLKPHNIEFLPMGVDDDAIPQNREEVRAKVRKELGVSNDEFLIVTGGKINKSKNTHILNEAIKRINNPHLHLIICGVLTPDMDYLKNEFTTNVHYLGWCNAQRVMNCMIASDLACFPGTHSTLWEQAVGVGLPAVLKRWNEMTHMNINDNCIFVEGENIKELQAIIEKFLDREFYFSQKNKSDIASKSFLYSEISKKAIGL